MISLRSLDLTWNRSSHFPARCATVDLPSMLRGCLKFLQSSGSPGLRLLTSPQWAGGTEDT